VAKIEIGLEYLTRPPGHNAARAADWNENMSESKHTPGPWRYLPNIGHISAGPCCTRVCQMHPEEATAPAWKAYREATATAWKAYQEATAPAGQAYQEAMADTTEANARLIAAAPDLLEACKGLVSMYATVAPYGDSPVVAAARAALAKATP